MTTFAAIPFSPFKPILHRTAPTAHGHSRLKGKQRRQLVRDLISDGACDSEQGVQMLMSVFPDQF